MEKKVNKKIIAVLSVIASIGLMPSLASAQIVENCNQTAPNACVNSTQSGTAIGVGSQTTSGIAVYGLSTTGKAGYFYSQSNDGGNSYTETGTDSGLKGVNLNVYSVGSGGNGVVGLFGGASLVTAYGNSGVYGASDTGNGVIGTTSASSQSAVAGIATGTNAYGVFAASVGSGGVAEFVSGTIEYTGSITRVSDERLKTNIKPMEGSLDKVVRLRGVTYTWKDPSQHGGNAGVQTGFIAQQVEQVYPEWVSQDRDGNKVLATDGFDAALVESVRTLKANNDTLQTRVNTMTYLFAVSILAMGGFFFFNRKK